jgi:nucleotide-binding universal stress UspA family protein
MSREKQTVSALNVTHYDDKVQKNALEYKKILAKYFYNHKTDVVQIQGLDKPQTISNYLSKIKPDLLVVVAHHYGFFQNLFHKSFSKQALRFAKSPVLVIKK